MGVFSSVQDNKEQGKNNVLDSDRSKKENFIYQNEYISQRSSNREYTTSKASKSISQPHSVNPHIQLTPQNSSPNQKKTTIKENPTQHQPPIPLPPTLTNNHSNISHIDKLQAKNQRIQQLHQLLNNEIKVYHRQKKQQLLQRKHATIHHHQDHHHHVDRSKRPKRTRTQVQSVMLGIWIGVTISIIVVLVVIIQINDLSIANQSNFSRDFPTWRGIAIWIWYVWILGMDIYFYDKFKIRYRQIFKIKPDHYPQPVNIYRIAGFHSSVFVLVFLFYVLDVANIYHIPGFKDEYFASISWGLFVLFLFMPLPIISNKGRFFVFSLMLDSILSPIKGVTFPVTWMTDQAVSMAVPLKDLQYTICYYTQMDFESQFNTCADNNRISTVLIVAVSVCSIRIVQCIRQGYDKGEFFMTPFFFNTLKYLATLLTAVFAFQYKLGADDIQAAWLLFAIISSFYSFVWDLKMDWDLLERNKFHPLLRQKLIFGSPKIYYLIIFGNFIMRLAWIMTISPKLTEFLGNNNLVFLVTGMIEIFRRGVWNLLRVQKQHIALITAPPKSTNLNDKALQLQQKLVTVQHSLNLQIKLLKFFKKFEHNRESLRSGLEQLNEQSIDNHHSVVQSYNRNFEEEELKEISSLMSEMLKQDSFLKKRLEEESPETKRELDLEKVEMEMEIQREMMEDMKRENQMQREGEVNPYESEPQLNEDEGDMTSKDAGQQNKRESVSLVKQDKSHSLKKQHLKPELKNINRSLQRDHSLPNINSSNPTGNTLFTNFK